MYIYNKHLISHFYKSELHKAGVDNYIHKLHEECYC